jgi:hypothetical protein
MGLIVRLVVVLSLLVLLGCSGISVSSDYNKSTDFSRLKTFSWMLKTPKGDIDVGGVHLLDRERIEDAIAAELANKGYMEIMAGASDFHVTYFVRTEERVQVETMQGPLIRPYWGMGYAEVYQYEEGTLIIDLLDATQQHIIWRGVGKGVVDWQGTTGGKTQLISEAVQKILAQFPPKP